MLIVALIIYLNYQLCMLIVVLINYLFIQCDPFDFMHLLAI